MKIIPMFFPVMVKNKFDKKRMESPIGETILFCAPEGANFITFQLLFNTTDSKSCYEITL